LDMGAKTNKDIYVFLHYPPYDINGEDNDFSLLLKQYPVKKAFYGHLHKNINNIIRTRLDDIPLEIVSADYLDFKLKLVL